MHNQTESTDVIAQHALNNPRGREALFDAALRMMNPNDLRKAVEKLGDLEAERAKEGLLQRTARFAHEINRTFCEAIGDHSQPAWDDAPDWQRESAISGVRAHIENRMMTPAQSHAEWMRHKAADGWTYGPEKDPERKTHPCMVEYDELPNEQRVKDHLFAAVVRLMC